MKSLVSVLLLAHTVIAVNAQQPAFRVLDAKDGLASNTVYFVEQDREGFIWLFTDKGICRYDGSSLKTVYPSVSIPYSRVYRVKHDLNRRIWFANRNNELAFTEYGKIHTYTHNQLLQDSLGRSKLRSFCFDSTGTLWIGISTKNQKSSVASITDDGVWKWHNTHFDECLFFVKVVGNDWVQGSHLGLHSCLAGGHIEATKQAMLVEKAGGLKSYPVNEFAGPCYHLVGNQQLLLTANHGGYILDKSGSYEQFTGEMIAPNFVFQNDLGEVFLKSAKNKVFKYGSGKLSDPVDTLFPDMLSTWVSQDAGGGYWFASFTKGAYHVPSLSTISYPAPGCKSNAYIRGLALYRDTIWLGYKNGIISLIKPKADALSISTFKADHNIYSASVLESGEPAFGYFGNGPKCYRARGRFLFAKGAERVAAFSDEQFLVSRGKVFLLGSSKQKSFSTPIGSSPEKSFSIFPVGFKHFYFSNENGVFRCDTGWVTHLEEQDPRFKSPVFDFKMLPEEWLAMASISHGLLLLRGETITQIDTSQGLLSNKCNKLVIDKAGYLWVATNSGINRLQLHFENDEVSVSSVQSMGYYDGLPIKDVQHLCIDEQNIWLAGVENLYRVDKNEMINGRSTVETQTYIDQITHKQKPYEANHNLVVDYKSGPIEIAFSSIFHKDPKSLRYEYRLNNNNEWQSTAVPVVIYEELPSGEYTFEVRAIHDVGNTKASAATFSFVVATPFWQTLWFIAISGLLLVSLVLFLFEIRLRVLKKREQLIHTAMSYKDQALRAQMNPHFIYNTLNSIQNQILRNDSKASSQHLSKFSRLVRTVFNHSSKDTIPLKQDLDALALYVELENFRFKNKVNYIQQIDPDIDLEHILIPPMLLQPLVENALVHGILPQEGKGTIELRVENLNTHLKFSISDDGVGASDTAFSADDRKSGTQITFERIERFNKENNFKGDLIISSQPGAGTVLSYSLAIKLKPMLMPLKDDKSTLVLKTNNN